MDTNAYNWETTQTDAKYWKNNAKKKPNKQTNKTGKWSLIDVKSGKNEHKIMKKQSFFFQTGKYAQTVLPKPLKMLSQLGNGYKTEHRHKKCCKTWGKRTQNYDKSRENGHKFMTI